MLGDTPLMRETLARLADTGVSVLDVEFLRFEPESRKAFRKAFSKPARGLVRSTCWS